MGTNFYFMMRNKELVQNNFANKHEWGVVNQEYEIVDEPYLGYEIHLNKLSCGWRPLFQGHKAFTSFKELEAFYHKYNDEIEIFDEYQDKYTWEEYYDRVYKHSMREKEPVKWVYEIDSIFKDRNKTLHTIRCTEEEADLFLPFDHILYKKTEAEAIRRLKVYRPYHCEANYWNDPDYMFDWTEGDFC